MLEDTAAVCLVLAGSGAFLALLLWVERKVNAMRKRREDRRRERERRMLSHRRQYMPGSVR